MKPFKDFLIENYQTIYRGKKLFSTIHYADREKERAQKPMLLDIYKKAVDHLKDNDYGDHHKFMFYSNKHDQAVVFDHKKQSSGVKTDNRMHLVATTILPKGDKHANIETKLIEVD